MSSQPQPEPIPGQMTVEEAIALSEKEDGPRLTDHYRPIPASTHARAMAAVKAKLADKEK